MCTENVNMFCVLPVEDLGSWFGRGHPVYDNVKVYVCMHVWKII